MSHGGRLSEDVQLTDVPKHTKGSSEQNKSSQSSRVTPEDTKTEPCPQCPKPEPCPQCPKPEPCPKCPKPEPCPECPQHSGIAPPATRRCHTVPLSTPQWICLESSFCASGLIGQTPDLASKKYAVLCGLDGSGRTRDIRICADYLVGEEMEPSAELFRTLANEEVLRLCPSLLGV